MFDKSRRCDGTFSRDAFNYDHNRDLYRCPGGKPMTTLGTLVNHGATLIYRASKRDCDTCALRDRCRPGDAGRKVLRSIHEGARDLARDPDTTATTKRTSFSTQSVHGGHFVYSISAQAASSSTGRGSRDSSH